MHEHPPRSTLFPYTTLFRSHQVLQEQVVGALLAVADLDLQLVQLEIRYCEKRAWYELRSEEHTSELQSHSDLVCRLLLEKKNKKNSEKEGVKRMSQVVRQRV